MEKMYSPYYDKYDPFDPEDCMSDLTLFQTIDRAMRYQAAQQHEAAE